MPASPDPRTEAQDATGLKPAPVLAVGIAGRRDFALSGEEAVRLGQESERLFGTLRTECARIVAASGDLFAPRPPRLRVVTGLAGGADLVIAAAARRAGAEVRVILPYGPELRAADLTAEEASLFAELLDAAPDPFVLDGVPGQARSHERAAGAILEVSDVLVAFWAGERDTSRAGMATTVQHAVDRRIPVLLLPDGPGEPVTLIDDPDELLLPPVAAHLPRLALADNVDRVLGRTFAPPASHHERQALRDWLGEPPEPRSNRFEYRWLLKLAETRPPDPAALSQDEEWRRARMSAARVSAAAGEAVDRLAVYSARIEAMAGHYGDQVRSGIVVRYLLAATGSLFMAGFALIARDFLLTGVLIQTVVTGGTILETRLAGRRRWNERWLDYRSLAERLRCDRFLQPVGTATVRLGAKTSAEDPAWMRWVQTRLLTAQWVGGRIHQEVVEAATRHLVEVEIASQIDYHHRAAIRARSLSRRLRYIGLAAVATTLLASVLLLLTRVTASSGLILAIIQVTLVVLPALYLTANGLRAEAGFDLAASRSEQALGTLRLLRQRIDEHPATFDRLIEASRAAAAAMILDTIDWRVGVQRSRQPYRGTSNPALSGASRPDGLTPGSERPRR